MCHVTDGLKWRGVATLRRCPSQQVGEGGTNLVGELLKFMLVVIECCEIRAGHFYTWFLDWRSAKLQARSDAPQRTIAPVVDVASDEFADNRSQGLEFTQRKRFEIANSIKLTFEAYFFCVV